jgi:hypothetical protein
MLDRFLYRFFETLDNFFDRFISDLPKDTRKKNKKGE